MESDLGMFGVTADRAKYNGSLWSIGSDARAIVRYEIMDITANYRVMFAEVYPARDRACVETMTVVVWNVTMTLVRLA